MEVNCDEASGGKVDEVEKRGNVEGTGEEEKTSEEDRLNDAPASSEGAEGDSLEGEEGDSLEEAGKVKDKRLVEEAEDDPKVVSLAGTFVLGTWRVVFGAVTGMLVNGAEDSGICSDVADG